MNLLVSVIIPVYLVENYLDRCVKSVLAQTYKNIEIILVDDGTIDNCAIMCDNYLLLDERIVVVHKQNGGLSDARNVGIELSSGDYIVFIDSDDFIKQDMVESLLQLVFSYHVKMAAIDIQLVDTEGAPIEEDSKSPLKNGLLSFEEYIKIIHQSNGWRLVVAWNKIYHREIFEKIRFPKGKKCEDEYIVAQIAWLAGTIAVSVKREYFYLLSRNGGIIQTLATKEKFEILLDVYKNRYQFFESIGCSSGKKYVFDNYCRTLLDYLSLPGKRKNNIINCISFYKKNAQKGDRKNVLKLYYTLFFRKRI